MELHTTTVELSKKIITANVLRNTLQDKDPNEEKEVQHNHELRHYEDKKLPGEENNEAFTFENLEIPRLWIQGSEVTEMDQLWFDIESSFFGPDEVDIDTDNKKETNLRVQSSKVDTDTDSEAADIGEENSEQNMENIFLIQRGSSDEDIKSKELIESNPSTKGFLEETHSGQLVPMDCMVGAQFEETKKQNQNEQFNKTKIWTKYNSPQILYLSKLTITVVQLLFSLILILAASHLYDASMATVALLSQIETATSHSSTWLQVEDIVPKQFQNHWVEGLKHSSDHN